MRSNLVKISRETFDFTVKYIKMKSSDEDEVDEVVDSDAVDERPAVPAADGGGGVGGGGDNDYVNDDVDDTQPATSSSPRFSICCNTRVMWADLIDLLKSALSAALTCIDRQCQF